jgi:hypothetical protein
MADGCYSADSIQDAICRTDQIRDAFYGLEDLGTSKGQVFLVAHSSGQNLDGDRLIHRGLTNCAPCQLCKRESGTTTHLMFKCRFTIRVWNLIYSWIGWQSRTPCWSNLDIIKQWWSSSERQPGYNRRAINSSEMLICWEIWNERNVRVFRNKASLPTRVAATIMDKGKTLVIAGARILGFCLPGE